jgi:hypothetical protein
MIKDRDGTVEPPIKFIPIDRSKTPIEANELKVVDVLIAGEAN